MTSQELKKIKLPNSSGVYFFRKNDEILYIGKATILRDRVRSYFSPDLARARGSKIVKMVNEADSIRFERTDSVLEALILEANYIKKYQPFYNSLTKDDKSFNYVLISKEKWPTMSLIRGKELKFEAESLKPKAVFGPYPHGLQLQEALKIIRKIFPFRDQKCLPAEIQLKAKGSKLEAPKPCFNRQIGLCPGVCTGEISKKDYDKTIRNLILFFSGKKRQVVRNLEKQMKIYAKNREFEKADEVKRQIFALNHIRDVSLLKNEQLSPASKDNNKKSHFRIESYDIAHTSGNETVGVMVVMENGELVKNEYRKFIIHKHALNKRKETQNIDDVGNLKEVLTRRFGHAEWSLPNLIIVDGAVAQINATKEILKEKGFNIEIISVVKDTKHNPRDFIGKKTTIEKYKKEILLLNFEAHRFAIAFHRYRRRKNIFK